MSHDGGHGGGHGGGGHGHAEYHGGGWGHDHGGGHGHDPGHGNGRDGGGNLSIVSGEDNVVVHIFSHAPCDVRQKLLRLVDSLDLLKIDTFRPNLMAEDRRKGEILMDNAWEEAPRNPQLPGGWYPGCTGSTRLWREFFQIGRREGWFGKGPLKKNFESRVYLEVECVTRNYYETGDAHTDLVIWIRSVLSWSAAGNTWGKDEYWVNRHRLAAFELSRQISCLVDKGYPARPEAAVERKRRWDKATGRNVTAGVARRWEPASPPARQSEAQAPGWLTEQTKADGASGADIDKLLSAPDDYGNGPG